jgi:hypothetical protein
MVIRAMVRARLLGLQLLTLEARVVVGAGDGRQPVIPARSLAPSEPGSPVPRATRPELTSSGPSSDFTRAAELLQLATDALERSRLSSGTQVSGGPYSL